MINKLSSLLLSIVFAGIVLFLLPFFFIRLGDKGLADQKGVLARRYFSAAKTLNPWRQELDLKLGQAEFWNKNFDQALKFYERAADSGKSSEDYYFWLGKIYFALKDDARALESFTKATEQGAMTASELNGVAASHGRLGNYREAKRYAGYAIGQAVKEGDRFTQAKAYNTMGLAYARSGDVATGERLIKNANLLWETSFFYESLGEVYEIKRDIPAAIAAYEKFVELGQKSKNPDFPERVAKASQKITELRTRLNR